VTDDRTDDPGTHAVEPMDEPPTPEGLEAEETAEIELGGDTALTDPIDRSGATQAGAGASVMRNSLLMGTGTVLSRLGGVLRGIALAAALGAGVVADAFTLGNTLPNVVYILIIGGALNAVFIPQLVRHMKDDSDGGDGYADRLITVVGVALLGLSVLAVLIAPWLVGLYATSKYTQDQFDLAVAFARFCLPQIFFYGVYTMLSQVLNSRGRFGAPMFAPLVNNAIAIATFVAFMVVAGPAAGADGILEPSQVTLLGLGTTLGVALQALVLVPVLLRSGYRYRARFDWKGVGLRTAGGLAAWTIGLVLVNQLAYAVIVRLATSVNAVSQGAGDTPAGLTAYTNAHLMFILPHSVITVSLVAALLPRMARAAADGRRSDLAADVSSGMRSASSLIIPAAIALMVLGTQAGVLLFNYGQTSTQSAQITGTLAAVFALGLLPFTLYYVIQRALYALERTRTAFWLTVVLNGLNLAIAVPLFLTLQAQRPSPSNLGLLALGYVAAYWLTLVVAWVVLSRATGGLRTRETLTAIARMSLAGLAMLLVMGGALLLLAGRVPGSPKIAAILIIAVVGTSGGLVYLGAARLLRIDEVTDVLAMLRRRVPGPR
jgi:putative peptidoglycan lipid II flippase